MPGISAGLGLAIGGIASAGAGAFGSIMNQRAANKGPQQVFPQQTTDYLQMLSPLSKTSFGTMNEMAATGMPTDVGPAWEAMMTANKRQTKQGYDQLLGSFGARGQRYSSSSMNGANDYLTQSNANFLQILANYTMQAQEAARSRQLAASQFGVSSAAQPALTMTGPQGSVAGAGLSATSSSLQTIALLQMLGMMSGRGVNGSPQATPPFVPGNTYTVNPATGRVGP